MIKTVIFDMDGTILNTLDDITKSINVSLEYHQLPIKTKNEVRKAVGRGALNLIIDVVPENSDQKLIDSVFKKYQSYYDTHSNDLTAPYPHMLDVLKQLKEMGYKLAVVSNKYEYLVKKLNDDVFESIFAVAIGETKDLPIKPAPDMLFKAIKLLDSTIEESIFIGDSDTYMKTAVNANITSIGVTWGFRDKETLIKEGAKYIISDPFDMIKIISEG
ncbi:HAD family hydrolase [Mycoplasmatota bacterium]|nr:HAD family hydrolase [Mycoplasmatota bacterium]